MNIQEIFADGISGIHITNNTIRVDLMTLQPHLKSENGQPVFNINHRLILPLEGFVQGFGLQQQILKQLADAGVIKKQEDNTAD
ncbi:hypothetical protein [Sporomusa sp. KB1]|jgi:hypothetical protein|uniref:hypothetical protein n=1 Tax=Sporomusa sp. KB1 TaxID=943346 RepID=UPI0011A4B9EC|nr:hypothetical protein [Sporomusa sp. KB1]TWH51618.1 hypothetical protein Salpa_0060 [Sporomusa sp. KB1]TWH52197.1 hypothetical protein Salpa_0719 [Sporomusa sp. KB1]